MIPDTHLTTRCIALAITNTCDLQCSLFYVKHTLLRAAKVHEDDWDGASPLDDITAHELLSTMMTCAMALEQLAGELSVSCTHPLQSALQALTKPDGIKGELPQ